MEELLILGNGRRKFLNRLFTEWHSVICDYEKNLDGDLPYAYGERTNIGILAAAARDIGGYPLEEYATDKKRKSSEFAGRGDLWIQDEDGLGWDFEAKHEWKSFFQTRGLRSDIFDQLRIAEKAVRKVKHKSRFQVGLVFLALYTRSEKPETDIEKQYEEKVGEFQNELRDVFSELQSGGCEGSHFMAAHFCPKDLFVKTGSESKYGGYDYYGGIVAICRFWENMKKKTGKN